MKIALRFQFVYIFIEDKKDRENQFCLACGETGYQISP